jgi:phage shock protein C
MDIITSITTTIGISLILLLVLFVAPALSAISIRRSLSICWHLFFLGICIFYGIFPMFLWLIGIISSEGSGCASTMDPSCPSTTWRGEMVNLANFAPWLEFLTIPSAFLGAIGLIISMALKVKISRRTEDIANRSTVVFYRSRHRKAIAGICAALARKWGLSILGVRIFTVILAVGSGGTPFILLPYFWLWLAFPLEPRQESIELG